MSFRPATTDDADFFWYWRERAEAAPWYVSARTEYDDHVSWFLDRIGRVEMLVWIFGGRPAGTARIDSNGEVSFLCNPMLGSRLLDELKVYAPLYGGRLKVTLDAADRASAKALKDAGFREYPVKFYCYRP